MWGLGIGLPLNLAVMAGPDELFFIERYAAAPIVMLGYIGLIGLIVEKAHRGKVMAAFESLGRTALSGYILQNLLASAILYGWGLGLAARVADESGGTNPWFSALATVGLWLAIGTVLLIGSTAMAAALLDRPGRDAPEGAPALTRRRCGPVSRPAPSPLAPRSLCGDRDTVASSATFECTTPRATRRSPR